MNPSRQASDGSARRIGISRTGEAGRAQEILRRNTDEKSCEKRTIICTWGGMRGATPPFLGVGGNMAGRRAKLFASTADLSQSVEAEGSQHGKQHMLQDGNKVSTR